MVQADRLRGPAKKGLLLSAAECLISSRTTNDVVKYEADWMLSVALDAAEKTCPLKKPYWRRQSSVRSRTTRGWTVWDGMRQIWLRMVTFCWADTAIVYTVTNVLDQHKNIWIYCDETRPYLQGAHLTASVFSPFDLKYYPRCFDSKNGSLSYVWVIIELK